MEATVLGGMAVLPVAGAGWTGTVVGLRQLAHFLALGLVQLSFLPQPWHNLLKSVHSEPRRVALQASWAQGRVVVLSWAASVFSSVLSECVSVAASLTASEVGESDVVSTSFPGTAATVASSVRSRLVAAPSVRRTRSSFRLVSCGCPDASHGEGDELRSASSKTLGAARALSTACAVSALDEVVFCGDPLSPEVHVSSLDVAVPDEESPDVVSTEAAGVGVNVVRTVCVHPWGAVHAPVCGVGGCGVVTHPGWLTHGLRWLSSRAVCVGCAPEPCVSVPRDRIARRLSHSCLLVWVAVLLAALEGDGIGGGSGSGRFRVAMTSAPTAMPYSRAGVGPLLVLPGGFAFLARSANC